MKQNYKLIFLAVIIIAWMAAPQDTLLLFLMERVFTLTNLVISILVALIYIQYLEIKIRANSRAMKQFNYRGFEEPGIADKFRERVKR